MKILGLLLIAVSMCFGSDLSGMWRLKHAAAHGSSFLIAVQVEQCGSDLQVLKVMASPQGRHIEQLWLTAAAIHTLARATEITVPGETWIIDARGELIINEASGERVVLEPAEGVVQ
jgi:hypothetical protein